MLLGARGSERRGGGAHLEHKVLVERVPGRGVVADDAERAPAELGVDLRPRGGPCGGGWKAVARERERGGGGAEGAGRDGREGLRGGAEAWHLCGGHGEQHHRRHQQHLARHECRLAGGPVTPHFVQLAVETLVPVKAVVSPLDPLQLVDATVDAGVV